MNLEIDNHYPTEDSLKQIAAYTGNFNDLMESISFYFEKYGVCKLRDGTWVVITGGWSGCESVIRYLEKNRMFWVTCWDCSKKGGYYEFSCRT